ncbi:hypothetical protein K4F52_004197 [Lecanicillium sp. MT-2017a]|nr:hypothetical protein K4F52_004197 [Lecanicillium sp. MT-2017a]
MKRGIDSLSPETLSQVLEQVHLSQSGPGGLHYCLLVCRQWKDIGLRILYRSLVVDMNRLRRLLADFDRTAVTASTRYLKIQVVCPEWDTADLGIDDFWQAQGEAVNRVLSRVPNELLSVASGLIGFSFSTDCTGLPRTTSAILRSLPLSCVELDINTNYEVSVPMPPKAADEVHLCDDLRTLLPRMRQAHVHLGSICNAAFGTTEEGIFRPTALPSMKRLLIDCGFALRFISRLCHQQQHGTIEPTPTSWQSVVRGLQQVSSLPETQAIIVAMAVKHQEELQRQIHTTIFRCRIADGQLDTWAFPITDVSRPKLEACKNWNPVYICTEVDNYVVINKRYLSQVSQGSSYWEFGSGLDTPECVTNEPYSASTSHERKIWTEKEWRETYPRNWALTWRNERLTGMRLLSAEKRQDSELIRVVEMTPEGWQRSEGGYDVERTE